MGMQVPRPGAPLPPDVPPEAPAPTPAAAPTDNRAGIVSAYQKYLNRTPGESDIAAWLGNNDYESGISSSPEAKAYGRVPTQTGPSQPTTTWAAPTKIGYRAPTTTTPLTFEDYKRDYHAPDRDNVLYDMLYRDYWAPDRTQVLAQYKAGTAAPTGGSGNVGQYMPQGVDAGKWADPNKHDPKYDVLRVLSKYQPNAAGLQAAAPELQAMGYRVVGKDQIVGADGVPIDVGQAFSAAGTAGQGNWWWNPMGGGAGSGGGGGGGTGAGGGAGSLGGGNGTTTGVGSLSGNPNVFDDPATTEWESQLRSLVDKLNQQQPDWTPSQLELQQTQALDPMERARQQQKQQAAQQLASRGVTSGSGVFDQAMEDIDRQFNQLRTTTQAAFATQAINHSDQIFQSNENRAINANSILKQIPQLADSRLGAARSGLTDPMALINSLLSQQNQQQQSANYNSAQDQQFWQQIAQIVAGMFT